MVDAAMKKRNNGWGMASGRRKQRYVIHSMTRKKVQMMTMMVEMIIVMEMVVMMKKIT